MRNDWRALPLGAAITFLGKQQDITGPEAAVLLPANDGTPMFCPPSASRRPVG
jgi:hypothetical protein